MELKQIFINSVGRLRSGWRLIVFVLVYLVVFLLISTLARVGYSVIIMLSPGIRLGSLLENFFFRLMLLVVALAAGFICARVLEGLPWRSLGLWLHNGWLRDLLVGSVIGIASLALAAGIATAGGGLSFSLAGRAALLQVAQTLIVSAALFVLAALAEEALFRGYPLQTTARAGLMVFGILLTSLAFAAAHMQNPNFDIKLPFMNLIFAGAWLAVAYLRTRSLWFPLGVHWAWNWALGSVFGLPVSGITNLAAHPLMRGSDLGPAWLTGGNYGIEGGLACTITLVVSTIFIWRTRLVSADPEMKRLTSQENPVVPERSIVPGR